MIAKIKITQRMLTKSIIDANKSVVEFVKEYLPVDYDHLEWYRLNGRKPRAAYCSMFTDGSLSEVRFYIRPRGDKLLSIKGITKKAKAGDTVTLSHYTGSTEEGRNCYISIDVIEGEAA
jgi:hypothetical protein